MSESLIHRLARALAIQRKTVRQYLSNPVSLHVVTTAIAAACQAPSGANMQPWRFIVVQDPNVKRQIRAACEQSEQAFYRQVRGDLKKWLRERGLTWHKTFLEQAPVLILVFGDRSAPYSTQSVWLAIGYILLVFEELGVATIPYTPSSTREVEHLVKVPATFRLEAILPVGRSNDVKAKEPRQHWQNLTYYDTWDRNAR